MKGHPGLWLITAAFIIVGVLYSLTVPVFESSDELWHYPYVKHIADGHGLPVQPGSGDYQYRQEGSQPPLYYLLGAALTFWIDTGPPKALWQPNPHARVGRPHDPDNKNIVLHNTAEETFPYRGVYLAVHLLRLLTVLFGAAAVALTYLIAWEVASRRTLASGAAALTACNLTFISIAASVDNDALAIALSSAALFLLLRLLKRGPSLSSLLLLGLLLGLASLTKLSALGLWLLTVLALAYTAYRRRSVRLFVGSMALVGLIGVAVAGWWYWRNLALYGDPLGLEAMLEVAGRREAPKSLFDLQPEMEGVFVSYWGLLGAANIVVSEWFYRFLRVLLVPAVVVGLVVAAIRAWRGQAVAHLPSLLLLGLWFAILFVTFIRWTLLTPASFGRLLFPAMAGVSIFLFLGLESLLPRRLGPALVAALGATGFSFALATPFLFILPSYPTPQMVGEYQLAAANQVYVNYDGKFELLAYELSDGAVRPGDKLKVSLYLRGMQRVSENYSLFVHLLGPDGRLLGQWDSYPGGGGYPTSRWQPDEIIKDSYTVPVTRNAEAPSLLWVDAGFYLLPSLEGIPAFDRWGQPAAPGFARTKLVPSSPPTYDIPCVADIPFEDQVRLLGYGLSSETPRPGDELTLTLYWQALRPLTADHTAFVHLVGPGDSLERWAQDDIQPRSGAYPTSLWEAGEVVEDPHFLHLPRSLPPGRYRLLVGLYTVTGMEHLKGPRGEKAVSLAEVEVLP